MRGGIVAGLVLLVLVPAQAAAGTAYTTLADPCASGDALCAKLGTQPVPVAVFAGYTEDNRVTATVTAPHEVTFADALSPMSAGQGCTQVDERSVRCPFTDTLNVSNVPAVALTGGGGTDQLTVAPGLTQPAALTGGDRDDVLAGGDEADTFDPGIGTNTVSGGGGVDTVRFSDSVHANFATGQAQAAGTGDALSSVEVVVGSPYDDTLIGSDADERLFGGGGRDRLVGAGGADLLDGGAGSDRIDGGAGHDSIFGDAGNDVLRGGAGADDLDGAGGNDRLEGGSGDDDLEGHGGTDVLLGGSGSDSIDGGTGRDRVDAGPGADVVDARNGARQTVRCGTGRDRAYLDRRDRAIGCERRIRPR